MRKSAAQQLFIEISRANAAIGLAEEAHGTNSVQHREAVDRREKLIEQYREAVKRQRKEDAA